MVKENTLKIKSKSNKKLAYEIKETPLLKKILNKILGPIRFFQKKHNIDNIKRRDLSFNYAGS